MKPPFFEYLKVISVTPTHSGDEIRVSVSRKGNSLLTDVRVWRDGKPKRSGVTMNNAEGKAIAADILLGVEIARIAKGEK